MWWITMTKNKNLKTKIGIITVAVLLTLFIIAGFKEGVSVQKAYDMTITNQQLPQAHLILNLPSSTTIPLPTTTMPQVSPYTSNTII
jgi:hypothetical protein